MRVEIGKVYRDGWGQRRNVRGLTRDFPEWVWTIQGEWYEQSTGKLIRYGLKDGVYQHYVSDAESYALVEEVADG